MTNASVESVDTSGEGVVATVKTKKGEVNSRSRYLIICCWNKIEHMKTLDWKMLELLLIEIKS